LTASSLERNKLAVIPIFSAHGYETVTRRVLEALASENVTTRTLTMPRFSVPQAHRVAVGGGIRRPDPSGFHAKGVLVLFIERAFVA
jgi:hypothetical protein